MNSTIAALLACLLSGWPEAPRCHDELLAKGPGAISEMKPALLEALKADPGPAVRARNNYVALTGTAAHRERNHPKTAQLSKARAAAEELGRLGEWKPLLELGTVTAVEGLAKVESPPPSVLKALVRWANGKEDRLRYASVGALKEYGPKALPVLPDMIAMLDKGDSARSSALDLLEKLGPAAAPAVPRLGVLIKDKQWSSGAYQTLKAIGTPEAERLLDDNPLWTPVSP
jgi:hypothetical protein